MSATPTEVELKLAVEGPFSPRLSGKAGVASVDELSPQDLHATYFDTKDLRLARSGVTLRRRAGESERPVWTLKLPGDGSGVERNELKFEAGAHGVPRAVRELVTAFARSEKLAPVARLRTRRRRWILRDKGGKELAELVDDRVSVLERGRIVERFRELEVEARTLDRPGLERIAAALARNGASSASTTPKLVRALGTRAAAPPEVIAPASVTPSDRASVAVRSAIAKSVERIVANDPHTRLGEPEPLHQMRVGARRLRSDLRTFGPLLEAPWIDELRAELRWLGGALGAVRDIDVAAERLRAHAGELEPELGDLFATLERKRAVGHDALLRLLRGGRYVSLLDALVEAAREPRTRPAACRPCRVALPPLAANAWKRLAASGRALRPGSSDADYHQARVRAKRARYAAEAIGPALPPDARRRAHAFALKAANVQSVLGELQDAVMARDLIEEVVDGHGHAAFFLAAGRLIEREECARADARAAFPGAWKRLDREKLVGWMRA